MASFHENSSSSKGSVGGGVPHGIVGARARSLSLRVVIGSNHERCATMVRADESFRES